MFVVVDSKCSGNRLICDNHVTKLQHFNGDIGSLSIVIDSRKVSHEYLSITEFFLYICRHNIYSKTFASCTNTISTQAHPY